MSPANREIRCEKPLATTLEDAGRRIEFASADAVA
jgi:predicted dehydrogenase